MDKINLTTITPELANDIIKYYKFKFSHGIVSVEGLARDLFKTECNGCDIYFNTESFNVLKSAGKKIKSESIDATTETN